MGGGPGVGCTATSEAGQVGDHKLTPKVGFKLQLLA